MKKSGFLGLVEAGDNVMADGGFTNRILLLRKRAYLNIPAFSKGKRLSSWAVGISRKIASGWIAKRVGEVVLRADVWG